MDLNCLTCWSMTPRLCSANLLMVVKCSIMSSLSLPRQWPPFPFPFTAPWDSSGRSEGSKSQVHLSLWSSHCFKSYTCQTQRAFASSDLATSPRLAFCSLHRGREENQVSGLPAPAGFPFIVCGPQLEDTYKLTRTSTRNGCRSYCF